MSERPTVGHLGHSPDSKGDPEGFVTDPEGLTVFRLSEIQGEAARVVARLREENAKLRAALEAHQRDEATVARVLDGRAAEAIARLRNALTEIHGLSVANKPGVTDGQTLDLIEETAQEALAEEAS